MTIYDQLRDRIRAEEPVALATVIDGPARGAKLLVAPGVMLAGTLGDPDLDRVVGRDALAELEAARSGVRHYGPQGQTTPEDLEDSPIIRVFVESYAPPPQMWIFGAVDFTAALAKVAKVLGYRVTVCDAREIFATRRRFPMADEVDRVVAGPAVRAPRRHARPARRGVHPHPRHQVRRAGGAVGAGDRRRLHRRDGQPHDPRQAPAAAARGRRRAGRPRPPDVTDRPRPRRPHARGDGDLDLRRDHRPPHRQDAPRASSTARARSTPDRRLVRSKTRSVGWSRCAWRRPASGRTSA